MYQVLCPQRSTVLRFRCVHVSWSGMTPGKLGAWKRVWFASEMWISAGHSAVRNAFRNIFPMTHACSHVKCANVNDLSSLASSAKSRVGAGSVLSILFDDDGAFEVGWNDDDMWRIIDSDV